jgi:beta-lactamase regulating signal transducer with metallopeptidase domain
MALSLMLSIVVRVTAVFAVSLGVVALMPRASASYRRLILGFSLCAALALGAIALAAPERPALAVVPSPLDTRIFAESPLTGGAPRIAAAAAPSDTTRAFRLEPGSALTAVWLAGVFVALARLGVGLWRVRRMLRRATPLAATLAESPDIEGPVVAGILEPRILLPRSARAWSSTRRALVLSHERAHVAGRDGLLLLLAELACAAYWFHPLSWLAAKQLRRECELSADEAVIREGVLPSSYAEHLLAVARAALVHPGSIAMAARPSELATRIETLLSHERVPARIGGARLVLMSAAALLVLAAAACLDTARPPTASASASAPVRAGSDRRAQGIVDEEAETTRSQWHSARVAVVVLAAKSGAVLAAHDDAAGSSVEPASTLKPLVVSLALDAGKITPESRFDCGNGQRAYGNELLRDARSYGELSVGEILAVSSNVGLSRIFDALGGRRLHDGLSDFAISIPEPIEDGSLRGAVLAIGHDVRTTPLAMARAYSVFANAGEYVAPGERRRVIGAAAAKRTLALLEDAVTSERATGGAARIPGVRVAGKTGSSDGKPTFATFVGLLPADRPEYVIYVGVAGVDPNLGGGKAAAPVFARIGKRLLAGT